MQRILLSFLIAFIIPPINSQCHGKDQPDGIASPTPVKLILQWTHQAQFAGYYAAMEKGFYADHGLAMTILRGGPGRDQTGYLKDGRADFAVHWLASALEDAAQGIPIMHVAQIVNRSNLILVSWKNSGITEAPDLNKRLVGLWGGQFLPPFTAYFNKLGIHPEIIRQNFSINLFLRHGVDACSAMYYNEYHMLFQAGINYDELLVFPVAEVGIAFPEDGIYCLRQTWQQKPETCKAIAAASVAGWKFAAEHPDETLDIVMEYTRAAKVPSNRAHMRWMLNTMLASIFPDKPDNWQPGRLSRNDYDSTAAMLINQKVINSAPDFDDFTIGESYHVE